MYISDGHLWSDHWKVIKVRGFVQNINLAIGRCALDKTTNVITNNYFVLRRERGRMEHMEFLYCHVWPWQPDPLTFLWRFLHLHRIPKLWPYAMPRLLKYSKMSVFFNSKPFYVKIWNTFFFLSDNWSSVAHVFPFEMENGTEPFGTGECFKAVTIQFN